MIYILFFKKLEEEFLGENQELPILTTTSSCLMTDALNCWKLYLIYNFTVNQVVIPEFKFVLIDSCCQRNFIPNV